MTNGAPRSPVAPALPWINLALKAALVALLAFGAFSGAEQFKGKAFGWRLATYPLAALVVPAGWLLRGRPAPYPHAMDVFLVLPFFVDVAGNALDLYDTVDWWDDANHFVNWALLSTAAGLFVARATDAGRAEHVALVIGFGATAAILWELAEYVSFIRNSPELETAYEDTLGDMALGLCGSLFAAGVTAALPRPHPASRRA